MTVTGVDQSPLPASTFWLRVQISLPGLDAIFNIYNKAENVYCELE